MSPRTPRPHRQRSPSPSVTVGACEVNPRRGCCSSLSVISIAETKIARRCVCAPRINSSYLMRVALWQFDRAANTLSPQGLLELLVRPGVPVGRFPGEAVVTLAVDPEGVVGDPVSCVTALVEWLQAAQDLGEGDAVCSLTRMRTASTRPDSVVPGAPGRSSPVQPPSFTWLAIQRWQPSGCTHDVHHHRLGGVRGQDVILRVDQESRTHDNGLGRRRPTPQIPCGTGVAQKSAHRFDGSRPPGTNWLYVLGRPIAGTKSRGGELGLWDGL
jgi:hypothetical protein